MYQNKNVYKSFIIGLALASLIENSNSQIQVQTAEFIFTNHGKLGYVSADIGLNDIHEGQLAWGVILLWLHTIKVWDKPAKDKIDPQTELAT